MARSSSIRPLDDAAPGFRCVEFVPQPPFDRRLVFTDQDTKRAAVFRTLRQKLIDREDARTILCSSPNPKEGKTTLAANLALAFSELGRYRVLLLEANFRAPALGALFKFVPPVGLGGQIDHHHTHPQDPWVLIQIGPPDLYILAAARTLCQRCNTALPDDARFCGKCGAVLSGVSAPPFLDAAGLNLAIRSFQRVFDYVIIDAPSILMSGDVNLIQDSADAVVIAVRKGKTDDRSLRKAVAQIAPAPVVAVTMFEE